MPRTRRAHPCQPALGGQFPDARGRASTARRSARAATSPCRASASPSASRSRRCERIAGADVVKLIREEPDETIWAIVQELADPLRGQAGEGAGLRRGGELRRDRPARISRMSWAGRLGSRAVGSKAARSSVLPYCPTPCNAHAIKLADSSSRPTTSTRPRRRSRSSRGCGCRCGRRRRTPRPSSWR